MPRPRTEVAVRRLVYCTATGVFGLGYGVHPATVVFARWAFKHVPLGTHGGAVPCLVLVLVTEFLARRLSRRRVVKDVVGFGRCVVVDSVG